MTTEFLNSINLSGLPPHLLTIKVGCVMMLLRNLNPKRGLCNGTRILITSVTRRVLRTRILTGSFQQQECIIPRVTIEQSVSVQVWSTPVPCSTRVRDDDKQKSRTDLQTNRIIATRLSLCTRPTLCGIFEMWIPT